MSGNAPRMPSWQRGRNLHESDRQLGQTRLSWCESLGWVRQGAPTGYHWERLGNTGGYGWVPLVGLVVVAVLAGAQLPAELDARLNIGVGFALTAAPAASATEPRPFGRTLGRRATSLSGGLTPD